MQTLLKKKLPQHDVISGSTSNLHYFISEYSVNILKLLNWNIL